MWFQIALPLTSMHFYWGCIQTVNFFGCLGNVYLICIHASLQIFLRNQFYSDWFIKLSWIPVLFHVWNVLSIKRNLWPICMEVLQFEILEYENTKDFKFIHPFSVHSKTKCDLNKKNCVRWRIFKIKWGNLVFLIGAKDEWKKTFSKTCVFICCDFYQHSFDQWASK